MREKKEGEKSRVEKSRCSRRWGVVGVIVVPVRPVVAVTRAVAPTVTAPLRALFFPLVYQHPYSCMHTLVCKSETGGQPQETTGAEKGVSWVCIDDFVVSGRTSHKPGKVQMGPATPRWLQLLLAGKTRQNQRMLPSSGGSQRRTLRAP